MIFRSTLVLALALPLVAQDQDKVNVGAFYKAYYLDKSQTKSTAAAKQAIGLYTAFLAANKDHKLAGEAAANCVVLMYAAGDMKGADAFGKKYGELMAAAEAKMTDANDISRMFRRGGGEANPNQGQVDKLMALWESAEGAKKGRLAGAIRRLGGARALMMAQFRGRGGRGGGFGGRGRGGRGGSRGVTKPKIAEMSKEDAQKAVERMVTSAERLIDSMAQRGQAEAADKLEAQLDKIQDLVDDGKMAEAQKLIDALSFGNSGGRGGNQGGRRRRGGDAGGAGGAGGGERRRRGGDAGAGAGAGERRRRG